MALEIELKFALPSSEIAALIKLMQQRAQQTLPTMQLTNTYYDTAERSLRQQDCGLRVRTTCVAEAEPQYELTLKCKRQSLSGLQQRAEYNVALSSTQPDLSRLPAAALPATLEATQLQNRIQPLFATNFQRQAWMITEQQSQIEVVLDQGEILAGQQSTPLLEVELELKQGEIADLLNFAQSLTALGLRLAELSKAARGYLLADQLSLTASALPHISAENPYASMQQLLHFWQQQEEFALFSQQLTDLQQSETYLQQQFKQLLSQDSLPAAQAQQLASALAQWQATLPTASLAELYQPARTALKLTLLQFMMQHR